MTTTTTKHTPGPWIAKPFDMNQCRVIPDGNQFFSVATVSGFNAPEAVANAKLIAAAPRLLEALKLLLGQVEGIKPQSGCHSGSLQADIRIARAAIQAATGQP